MQQHAFDDVHIHEITWPEQDRIAPERTIIPRDADLSTDDAARALGMRRAAVRRAIRQARLPARKLGRDWVISFSAVQAYMVAASAPGRRGPRPKGFFRD